MATASSVNGGIVLNSWKEIAAHVGRGVRTVQRWERDLGMPVRRPRGKSRSAVIAMSDEIDAWLRSAPTSELSDHQKGVVALNPKIILKFSVLHESMEQHEGLRDRCFQLRHANHEALARLIESVRSLQITLTNFNTLTTLRTPKESEKAASAASAAA